MTMIGSQLGKWVLDKELGSGGMGRVYLAHENAPGSPIPNLAAVKVLAVDLALDQGFLLRFQREIDALSQLNHPNIVRFFESGAQGGRYFYAMEYVAGPSFEELLAQQKRLPWPEVLDMALQVCPALKHMHDRGIIHRDLKPSNLLRAESSADSAEAASPGRYGIVKLTDFGIAHVFARNHLTATGGIIGTAEYLSPEQAAGKPVSKRSDLYSLGVVLYTLLTGKTPFVGDSVIDLLHKHKFAQFDQIRKFAPDVPFDLEEIVNQLLAKEPERRQGDGLVLQKQLDSLARKMARKSSPQGPRDSDPRPLPDLLPVNPTHEGPATMMSRLMREELDRQNLGGPLARFINRPAVLTIAFLACLGLIVWGVWPASAESLFHQAQPLMASDDPEDWSKAWDYLDKLNAKYPDNPYQDQIEAFREKEKAYKAERKANAAVANQGHLSEAQWFYYRGLHLRQQGDEASARRCWTEMIRSFRGVSAEKPWVRLAERELEQTPDSAKASGQNWDSVRVALKKARALRQENRGKEADEIYDSLMALYKDDSGAKEILDEIRQEREK